MNCPNCGSDNMVLTTNTAAQFAITEDGKFGEIMNDEEAMDYATELRSEDSEDVEFKCRECHSSFVAVENDDRWTIGDGI